MTSNYHNKQNWSNMSNTGEQYFKNVAYTKIGKYFHFFFLCNRVHKTFFVTYFKNVADTNEQHWAKMSKNEQIWGKLVKIEENWKAK